ncbi:MAG: hypothetical protein K2L51_05395 [Clostridiales bacterium]|nr:hypothetical protein [Clostridiales bacterium]
MEIVLILVSIAVGLLSALSLYLGIRDKAENYEPPSIEQEKDTGGTAQEDET